jgi:hypothetical protein
MKNVFLPACIALCTVFAGAAMSAHDEVQDSAEYVLPVDGDEAEAMAPWLKIAANEMVGGRVRAYEAGVFVDAHDARLAWFTDDAGQFVMRVGFPDTRFRHGATERAEALAAIKAKGDLVFARALALQADKVAQVQTAQTRQLPTG